jgi:hypothetical protein
MAIEHLVGKRSGRPPGARSRSRVKRDLNWAYRHLDKPESVPPSAGAKRWSELARSHPEVFLACVAMFDTAGGQPTVDANGKLPHVEPNWIGEPPGNGSGRKPLRRLRKIFICSAQLLSRLTSDGCARISGFPRDASVVGCDTDPARDGMILILYSDSFSPVADDVPIPELTLESTW